MSKRGQQDRDDLSISHAAKRRKIEYERGGQKVLESGLSVGNGRGVPVKTCNRMLRLGDIGDDVLATLKNGSDIMQEHRRRQLLKWTALDKVSRGSR
jgi:hypothetical protein